MLVTGRSSMRRTGIADRVTKLLSDAGISTVLYDRIESDPRSKTIDAAVQLARSESCDLVIGLGGGSPMDAARAIAGMAASGGSILEHVRGKPIEHPGLPLLCIATTSGTASEITPVAVVTDEERELKMGVKSPYWFAKVAVTDPELTVSMPPEVTAATGLDALTHAVESYLSTGATAPSEGLALRAIELVGAHLRDAFRDGSNRAARDGMSLASMTAGMAFANSGLGLVHALVHPVGARHSIAHGAACGRLLPGVLRYNQSVVPEKLGRVGAALTGKPDATADDAIEAIEALLRDMSVPCGLGDVTISEQQMAGLAKDGLLAGALRTNPRPVTEQDALEVLQRAHRG
jgi:1,3-propanediol dehydrogenase/alcohol dehydrogenase